MTSYSIPIQAARRAAAILKVRDLSVEIHASGKCLRPVDGIGFDIAAGECYALLGESGCGKSMTALGLMGLLPNVARVTSGTVEFQRQELLSLSENEMRRIRGGGVGMIFQEPATSLNPVLTIGQQIVEAITLHSPLRGAAAKARAAELLTQVGIADATQRLDAYPFQFSGGMRQRVMIAMALAGEPRLLIADEPTTALDVTIQAQVLDLLDRLRREQGMALLLITHDLGVVARMADRVGVMYAGQLVEEATRERFFQHSLHPYSRRLFAAVPDVARRGQRLATISGSVPAADTVHRGCRFTDRCAEVLELCRELPPPCYRAPDGHFVRCHRYAEIRIVPADEAHAKVGAGETDTPAPRLLQVDELAVHFPIKRGILQRQVGAVRAVDGVSLTLAAGRTLALVGESGCGKTTVGKAILHLVRPSAGRVSFAGTELTTLAPKHWPAMRANMQMVFQDPFASLNPRLRVGEIIAEGMRALHIARNVDDLAARSAAVLQQVGLSADMLLRYPHEFSGGQRQRLAIARALAVSPQLLICDEPTSALDVSVQAQILNLLSDLQRELKLAYLFITHNLGVVEYLAHDVAVMYLGRIVERGPTEALVRRPRHPYTQALLAAVPPIEAMRAEKRTAPRTVGGDMPSPANPPSGCHFHPRCPQVMPVCKLKYPDEVKVGEGHGVRCFAVG